MCEYKFLCYIGARLSVPLSVGVFYHASTAN